MAAYILRRLLQSAVMVFLVASLVAVLIHLIPGDPTYVILGENQVTPERVAAVRKDLGLDRPILVQYGEWLRNAARGDFGSSLTSKREIAPDLAKRLPRTFELIFISTILSVVIGIPAGIVAARHHNRPPDIVVSTLALIGVSSPVFVVGTLLLLVFGVKWEVLPATGFVAFWNDPLGHVQRLILPSVTLAILNAAVVLRMTRSSLLEVLGEDYVRTARAKGLTSRRVLYAHALRNALVPVITVVGLEMGSLLGGTVLVEYIFNWPGLSTYLIMAISQRDYPVVQTVVLVIATLFVLLNLLTDLLYAVVDPRIRYG
ncbi:MAG: ABC transporter permease [Thermomicrobiales bacterium]